ncbi:MAG: hypothetical protein JNM70_20670 [Anaerolineae bacterium]|nr:hypothetical protein [Anaerolineae bacterium]
MSIVDRIVYTFSKPFIEWPTLGRSMGRMADQLENGLQPILDRFQRGGDSERSRRVLSHIIGIERWGQNRLKVFEGNPLAMDEYNDYRPSRETSGQELVTMMRETRAETVRLARRIAGETPTSVKRVPHNQFGPLTARGWLFYLYVHARAESRKMRAQ